MKINNNTYKPSFGAYFSKNNKDLLNNTISGYFTWREWERDKQQMISLADEFKKMPDHEIELKDFHSIDDPRSMYGGRLDVYTVLNNTTGKSVKIEVKNFRLCSILDTILEHSNEIFGVERKQHVKEFNETNLTDVLISKDKNIAYDYSSRAFGLEKEKDELEEKHKSLTYWANTEGKIGIDAEYSARMKDLLETENRQLKRLNKEKDKLDAAISDVRADIYWRLKSNVSGYL